MKHAIWLLMMTISVGLPGYGAVSIAEDWPHRLLFGSFAAPLICFAMAFYSIGNQEDAP